MFLESCVVILMKNYFIQIYGCTLWGFFFIGINGASFCVEK